MVGSAVCALAVVTSTVEPTRAATIFSLVIVQLRSPMTLNIIFVQMKDLDSVGGQDKAQRGVG